MLPINRYPYTDQHEMNMDWVLRQVQDLVAAWAQTETEWHNTQEEWTALYNYVHDYFDNLDVTQEVQNAIDQMIIDGTLQPIIAQVVSDVYDAVPTQNSTLPVQSGGVWQAIEDAKTAVQNTIESTYVNAVNLNDMNPVTSNAVYRETNRFNDPVCLTGAIEIPLPYNAGYSDISGTFKSYYYKIGHRVFISICVAGLPANSQVNIAQMPAGYRPHNTVCLENGAIELFNDGNLAVKSPGTSYVSSLTYDAYS